MHIFLFHTSFMSTVERSCPVTARPHYTAEGGGEEATVSLKLGVA